MVPALLACFILSGCAVGPDYKRPRLWSPSSWSGFGKHTPGASRTGGRAKLIVRSTAVESSPDPSWWDQFKDPELSALERRVAQGNLDVRLSTVRLIESRAQLRQTTASQYFSINGSASYKREQFSAKEFQRGLQNTYTSGGLGGLFGPGGNTQATRQQLGSLQVPPVDIWQDGIDASWELDLWGRVRRSIEAAKATLQASQEDQRSSLVAGFAEVARDYMTLRGQQAQLAILRDNQRVAQQSVDLTRTRFRGGLTTELDVENAVSQLDSVVSQIPDSERQIALQINAIGLLLGEPPQALRTELETAVPVPPVPPRVPVGVPSELARRRADIRQAEAQLHAATATVGVAVAAFYPRVTLTGALNFDALSPRDLGFWSAAAYTLGPSINIPIFQGGQLRAQLQLNEARQQESAVNYQRTVLQAWQDVDNALTAYAAEQRKHDALERSVRSYQRALTLARQQYANGLQTFLNVLDAERGLFSARGQLVGSTTAVSSDLVQLYNALGGGWETAFPEAQKAAVAGGGKPAR